MNNHPSAATPRRIAMRGGKDPLLPVAPALALQRNLVQSNTGNIMFASAAHKIFSGGHREIVTFSHFGPNDADRINDEFDGVALPLANALRANNLRYLDELAQFVERLDIPLVVPCVGAQASLALEVAELQDVDDVGRRFVRAVLEKSESIGVRGEFTKRYLEHLGAPADAVSVVGCPSMFTNGPDLAVQKKSDSLDENSQIAVNLQYSEPMSSLIVESNRGGFPLITYVAQDVGTFRRLVWGERPTDLGAEDDFPRYLSHPLMASGRTKVFSDASTWIDFLRTVEFSFGPRIHGNIAALLGGTPAVVLAHDSRTLELAEYFDIPFRRSDSVERDLDLGELFREADFTRTIDGHASRFSRMQELIHTNGFGTIHDQPEERERYEDHLGVLF